MYLTLEVISSQAASLGSAASRTVGSEGLTIGRSADNDWVLPDPYISKQHARIGFAEGQFFVEGLGKNPIALGRIDNVIPSNQPQPLSEGDRIFIDQYEFLVTLTPVEATTPDFTPDGLATERIAEADESYAPAPGRRARSQDPEATVPERPGFPGSQPRRASASSVSGSGPGPALAGGAVRSVQARTPPAPRSTASGVSRAAGAPGTPRPTSELTGDLITLLQAAGVPQRDWTPELAQELVQVMRLSVEGVMEMLRARTEIKAQFQLPLTRVKARENNPLKLLPNVESVLHTLLVQRNPAYMPTMQAFEDANADIRHHQAALLVGLRAAFDSLLGTFEPAHLQSEFDGGSRRGGLFGGRPRYWEQYVERFEQLGSNTDETFRRLCGEVFAEAYEQELERLKSGG
jgi:type VI secretion system protein ImpI